MLQLKGPSSFQTDETKCEVAASDRMSSLAVRKQNFSVQFCRVPLAALYTRLEHVFRVERQWKRPFHALHICSELLCKALLVRW